MNPPTYWLESACEHTLDGLIQDKASVTVGLHDARHSCATLTHRDTERPGNRSVHQKDLGRSSGATIDEAMAEIIQNPTASTRMMDSSYAPHGRRPAAISGVVRSGR